MRGLLPSRSLTPSAQVTGKALVPLAGGGNNERIRAHGTHRAGLLAPAFTRAHPQGDSNGQAERTGNPRPDADRQGLGTPRRYARALLAVSIVPSRGRIRQSGGRAG